MRFIHALCATTLTLALAGCGAGMTAPVPHSLAPQASKATTGPAGQQISVTPSSIAMTACQTGTATVQTAENDESEIDASSSDPAVATVSSAAERNAVDPTTGGTKYASFAVTAHAAGTATITVVDKKGSTGTVAVIVAPCAPPSPPALTLPPPTVVPTCAPASTATSADRRRVDAGGSGAGC